MAVLQQMTCEGSPGVLMCGLLAGGRVKVWCWAVLPPRVYLETVLVAISAGGADGTD